MEIVVRGRVAWKFDDFFAGDQILGLEAPVVVQILHKHPDDLKKYVLTWADPEFPQKFRKGDMMIAGQAFGGTRDHASVGALKSLGVSLVIAESFSRVWRRRAIMNALPVLQCPGITQLASKGDELEVNLKTGVIKNLTTGQELKGTPAIEPQLAILEAGGITQYLKKKIEAL
jgi:3-isopropylmalate/(R)-2-methylmalate dehydratase small subunit